jgi:hypothetical protein
MTKYNLVAAAKISIMDSYEWGTLLIFKQAEKQFSGLCVQGRVVSPLFNGDNERKPYDACREWFSDRQDGFLDVETLELNDDSVKNALERSKSRLSVG